MASPAEPSRRMDSRISMPGNKKQTPPGLSQAPTSTARLPAGEPEDLGLEVLTAMVRSTLDGLLILDHSLRCAYANAPACAMLGCRPEDLQGRDLMACPRLEEGLGRDRLVAVFGGKHARWEAVLPRADASELLIECTATRLDVQSRKLLFVIFRDVTEQRRQAREAAALAQAATSVAVSDSIEATIQSLAESVLRGTRALGATVLLNDEEDIAVWIGAAGMPDGYAESLRAAISAGYRPPALRETWVAGKRMLIDRDARRRVESDPKRAELTEAAGWGTIPWQAAVYAPLVYQSAVVGTLIAIYREGELPSEGEMAFLATMADQAAVAAMNARLMTAARDKAALEERQRLARELHDSVSQALYGILLNASTADELFDAAPVKAHGLVRDVLGLAEGGLAELRALIFELRPESLEREGLVGALEKQVAAVQARHGIRVRMQVAGEPDLPQTSKEALYRVAQEAMHNAVKHARARTLDLCLELGDAEVGLVVADDGRGFDPAHEFPGHLGLKSMAERAAAVGGTLEIKSAPGEGTRLRARFPLAAHA
jgi:PAS domain S-box-containing protein